MDNINYMLKSIADFDDVLFFDVLELVGKNQKKHKRSELVTVKSEIRFRKK